MALVRERTIPTAYKKWKMGKWSQMVDSTNL